jgi:hypothetical protein
MKQGPLHRNTQLLGTTAQNLVARATWRLGFVHTDSKDVPHNHKLHLEQLFLSANSPRMKHSSLS